MDARGTTGTRSAPGDPSHVVVPACIRVSGVACASRSPEPGVVRKDTHMEETSRPMDANSYQLDPDSLQVPFVEPSDDVGWRQLLQALVDRGLGRLMTKKRAVTKRGIE